MNRSVTAHWRPATTWATRPPTISARQSRAPSPAPPGRNGGSRRAALFVDDRELHRRINPALGWEKFRAALREAERDPSFPKA
jgi:hypothetical protein